MKMLRKTNPVAYFLLWLSSRTLIKLLFWVVQDVTAIKVRANIPLLAFFPLSNLSIFKWNDFLLPIQTHGKIWTNHLPTFLQKFPAFWLEIDAILTFRFVTLKRQLPHKIHVQLEKINFWNGPSWKKYEQIASLSFVQEFRTCCPEIDTDLTFWFVKSPF